MRLESANSLPRSFSRSITKHATQFVHASPLIHRYPSAIRSVSTYPLRIYVSMFFSLSLALYLSTSPPSQSADAFVCFCADTFQHQYRCYCPLFSFPLIRRRYGPASCTSFSRSLARLYVRPMQMRLAESVGPSPSLFVCLSFASLTFLLFFLPCCLP